MIDTLHEANGKQNRRPKTYRQKARKDYLTVSKQKGLRKKQIRQAVKKQLQYCRRNLKIVDQMLQQQGRDSLSQLQEKLLNTIRKLITQQMKMYKAKNIVLQRLLSKDWGQCISQSVIQFGDRLDINMVRLSVQNWEDHQQRHRTKKSKKVSKGKMPKSAMQ